MLVASGQAPSTFLYLRTFVPVPTPLSDRLALFFIPVNGIIEKNKYIFAFLSDTNNNRSVRYQVKERWLL